MLSNVWIEIAVTLVIFVVNRFGLQVRRDSFIERGSFLDGYEIFEHARTSSAKCTPPSGERTGFATYSGACPVMSLTICRQQRTSCAAPDSSDTVDRNSGIPQRIGLVSEAVGDLLEYRPVNARLRVRECQPSIRSAYGIGGGRRGLPTTRMFQRRYQRETGLSNPNTDVVDSCSESFQRGPPPVDCRALTGVTACETIEPSTPAKWHDIQKSNSIFKNFCLAKVNHLQPTAVYTASHIGSY